MINLLAMLRPITQKGTDVQTGLPGTAGGSEESLGGFAALIQKLVGEFVGGRTPSKSDLEAGANNSSQSLTSEAATTADAPPAAGVSRPPAGVRPMAVSTKKKEEEKAVGRSTGDSTQIAPQVTSTALTETLAAVYAMLQDQVPTPKAPLAEGEKTPACEADGGKGSPSATGPASVSSLTAGKISSLFAHGITAQSILSFPLGSNPTHSDAQSADGESGPPPTNEAKTERPGTLVLDMLKTVSASKMMTQAAEDFTNSLKASSPQDGSAGTVTRGRVNWTPPKEGVPAAQPADPKHLEGDLAIQSNPDPKQLEGVLAVQSNPDPKHLEGVLAVQANPDLKASPSNPPQGEQATHSATLP
ncbi:MAG TPA: hypothetical protein VEO56_03035, partial [Bacteroidota bacterium]|nr:hypothetical protein [Bacteroidota bacterium]